jgi:hypothetical protein
MSPTTANHRKSNETPLAVRTEAAIGHPKYSIVDETKILNETEEDTALTEEPTTERKDEAPPERLSLTGVDRLIRHGTKNLRRMSVAALDVPYRGRGDFF